MNASAWLSGVMGVRNLINFQVNRNAPFGHFAPACFDSESSFKRISLVLDRLWLLNKLGLCSFVTHKDVVQVERFVFVEKES